MSSNRKLSRATVSTNKTAKQVNMSSWDNAKKAKMTSGDRPLDIDTLTPEITKTVTNTVMDSLRQSGLLQTNPSIPVTNR